MPKFVSANVICTVATMIMIGLGLVIARDLFGPWLFMLGAIGILGAVLMAIGTRGATRIYWLGFSVAALGYSGYSWQFDRHGYAPPYHGPELTVQALWQMRDRYVADTLEVGPPPGSSLIIRSGWSDAAYNPGREKTFFLIGHMGWAPRYGRYVLGARASDVAQQQEESVFRRLQSTAGESGPHEPVRSFWWESVWWLRRW